MSESIPIAGIAIRDADAGSTAPMSGSWVSGSLRGTPMLPYVSHIHGQSHPSQASTPPGTMVAIPWPSRHNQASSVSSLAASLRAAAERHAAAEHRHTDRHRPSHEPMMQVSAFAQPLPPALQQQFSEVQSPSLSAPQNAVDAAPFAVATVYPHTAVPIAEHHHHHHDSLASNLSPAPSAWDTHPQFAISRAASIQVPHTRRSQDISRVSGITGPIAAAALTLPQPPPPAPRKSTPLPDPVLSEQGSLTQPLLTNQCDETASEAPGYTDGPGAPTGPIQPALAPGWASEQKTAPAWPPTSPLRASVFGLINTAVGLPALIALTAIVYKDPVYTPYLGSLCKFFFFASGVHQLVFSLRSSVPFAVGQIQDVGLIFLSAMASSVAEDSEALGLGPRVALGTALTVTALSTFLVGAFTVFVGRFRLAQLVQYVPLPVVGGYLSYVGYFCIAGGIALGCSTEVDTLSSWVNLLTWDAVLKLIPTLVTCVTLMLTMEHCPHPLALPAMLAAIPVLFRLVLLAAGVTVAQAQDAGWVMKPTEGSQMPWDLWRMYNFGEGLQGICWSSMLGQLPKLIGLCVVVTFGSCMDIAAVQADIPTPIDFNSELVTVGVSNCVVGALGAGYTGSFIFSQTVFTKRAGVYSRVNGYTLALAELLVFALPFSVVQYCPSFFYGSLLLWFGIEITRDWLVLSFRKLSIQEYLLLWFTFSTVMLFDLEVGIALGVVASTLYFAYNYARSQEAAVREVPCSSGSVHSYEVASVLELLSSRVVTCALGGFVFFGSSISMSQAVEKIADDMLSRVVSEYRTACDTVTCAGPEAVRRACASSHQSTPRSESPVRTQAPTHTQPSDIADSAQQQPAETGTQPTKPLQHQSSKALSLESGAGRGYEVLRSSMHLMALADAPLFLILNLRNVKHVDATGARTLSSLIQSLEGRGVHCLVSDLHSASGTLRRLLHAHGVALQPAPDLQHTTDTAADTAHTHVTVPAHKGEGLGAEASVLTHEDVPALPSAGVCYEFSSSQAAMQFVEQHYTRLAVSRGVLQEPPLRVSLPDILHRHSHEVVLPHTLMSEVSKTVSTYAEELHLNVGDTLLECGALVDSLLLVVEGSLQLHMDTHSTSVPHTGSRVTLYPPGSWTLASEFVLQRGSPGRLSCAASPCMVLCVSRSAYQHMLIEAPQALSLLQWTLLRFSSMELAELKDRGERMGL